MHANVNSSGIRLLLLNESFEGPGWTHRGASATHSHAPYRQRYLLRSKLLLFVPECRSKDDIWPLVCWEGNRIKEADPWRCLLAAHLVHNTSMCRVFLLP